MEKSLTENNVVEFKPVVVEQKTVPFGDAELIAVKTQDGKLYAAVKWVCEGIGLTEDQAKRQVKNIQSDLVVSRSVSNLTLNTNAGVREGLCMELDYLPLWLAKIAITPNMQETNPQAVENLVNYQLKAKDVLAQAFLPKTEQDPITLALEAALETRKQVQVIQTDVNYLKNTMRVDTYEQAQIQTLAKQKALDALGGMDSQAYRNKPIRSKTFSALWKEFKHYFKVARYGDLPKSELIDAIDFLNGWHPPRALEMEIQAENQQPQLF